jgi:hypothetical protein
MEKAFISYQREKNRQGKGEAKERERESTHNKEAISVIQNIKSARETDKEKTELG